MIPLLRPGRVADSLRQLVTRACELLDLLAENQTLQLDESAVSDAFPGGQSLLDTLHAEIEGVASLPRSQRELLAEACRNDADFDVHVDVPDFRFRFPLLERTTRERADELLVAFYEKLLRRGVTELAGLQVGSRLDRLVVERAFFDENGEHLACPACMGERITPTAPDAAATIDCEHFLPKSLYPVLSVHPANLLFICIPCNRRRKGVRDPLTRNSSEPLRDRAASGALFNSYVPYHRAAGPDLTLEFERSRRVRLTADTQLKQARVDNLEYAYQLIAAWTPTLAQTEHELLHKILFEQQRQAGEDEVRAQLEGAARVDSPTMPHSYVRSRYARYLLEQDVRAIALEWQRVADEQHRAAEHWNRAG